MKLSLKLRSMGVKEDIFVVVRTALTSRFYLHPRGRIF
jgi:hypothetical protein